LFRDNGAPVWHRRLVGTGKFYPQPNAVQSHLLLDGPLAEPYTVLAVADVPGYRQYEFTIELKQSLAGRMPSDQGRAGAFWGWRPGPDPSKTDYRCFATEVDERLGRATIGTCRFDPGDGVRGPRVEWLRPLANGRGVMPLLPLPPQVPVDGHRLRVRVLSDKITVIVDRAAPWEFDLAWFDGREGRAPATRELDGALGVWVSKGQAWFRNSTFTRLAADARGD